MVLLARMVLLVIPINGMLQSLVTLTFFREWSCWLVINVGHKHCPASMLRIEPRGFIVYCQRDFAARTSFSMTFQMD